MRGRCWCFGVLSRAHGPPRGKARAAGKAVRLGKARNAASRWPVRAGRCCKVQGTLSTCAAVSHPTASSHAPDHAALALTLRELARAAGIQRCHRAGTELAQEGEHRLTWPTHGITRCLEIQ